MNDTVMINDHRLKISTKTVKANGRNYIYYIAKMNLGKDPTTGKQRQHDFTANSKEELIKILERELCKPVLPPEASYPLSLWLDTWVNVYIKNCYRYSTIANYQRKIAKRIKPELGEIALKDLDEYKISKFYKKLEMQGSSDKTIKSIHIILDSALKYAVAKHYLYFNPCDVVPLKKKQRPRPTIFSPRDCVEFKKIIAHSPYNNLFGLLMGTGMRIGEAIGLSWDCVDLEKRRIYICNQITKTKKVDGTGCINLWQTTPKNGVPHYIYISEKTAKYIEDEKMKQEKQKLGEKWHNEHNLVFTRPNGSCLDYARVNEHFKAAVTLIGRPELTIHSIRHTYASVVWAMTHNLNAVKDALGHCSFRTSLDYIVTPEGTQIKNSEMVADYWDNALTIENFNDVLSQCPSELFEEN